MQTPSDIRDLLSSYAEEGYGNFVAKLIPTMARERILGVRAPTLRRLTRGMTEGEREAFLADLPHRYYDEDLLHVYLISGIRDFDACRAETEKFLPYLDNWATCDSLRPKIFKSKTDELFPFVQSLLASPALYTRRLGIGFLLSFYLQDAFRPHQLSLVAAMESEEYYLRMMQGWYFATALALQYDATLPWFTECRLSPAVRASAIRKACESHRISPDTKALLKAL